MMLCYADHHDNAYRWAEQRRLDIHPDTGAAQITEIKEVVEEVVRTIYKDIEKEAALFAGFEDDYLSALGVPAEWLDAVKIVGESGFVKLIDSLPQEASEHLMKLHNGIGKTEH